MAGAAAERALALAVWCLVAAGGAHGRRLPPAMEPGRCDTSTVDVLALGFDGGESLGLGSTVDLRAAPIAVNSGTFWDQSVIDANQQARDATRQTEKLFTLDRSLDTVQNLGIDISASIKLLSGSFSAKGEFKFLDESSVSSRVLRTVYRISETKKVFSLEEGLLRQKVAADSRHYATATHVVTEVTTGFDAFLYVDISLLERESRFAIDGSLEGTLRQGIISGTAAAAVKFFEDLRNEGRTVSFFYEGDAPFEDAINGVEDWKAAYDNLRQRMAEVNDGAGVPKSVKLTPLCAFREDVVNTMVKQLEEESLAEVVEMYLSLQRGIDKASDVARRAQLPGYEVPRIQRNAERMQAAIEAFKTKLRLRLQQLIPLMQTSPPELDAAELPKLADYVAQSPFGEGNIDRAHQAMNNELEFFRVLVDNTNELANRTTTGGARNSNRVPSRVRMLRREDVRNFDDSVKLVFVAVNKQDSTDMLLSAMDDFLAAPNPAYTASSVANVAWYPNLVGNTAIREAMVNLAEMMRQDKCAIWSKQAQGETCLQNVEAEDSLEVLNKHEYFIADYYSDPEPFDDYLRGVDGVTSADKQLDRSSLFMIWDTPRGVRIRKDVYPTPWLDDARNFYTGEPTVMFGQVPVPAEGEDLAQAKRARERGACAYGIWDAASRLCTAPAKENDGFFTNTRVGALTCLDCGNLCLSGTEVTTTGKRRLTMAPCEFGTERSSAMFKIEHDSGLLTMLDDDDDVEFTYHTGSFAGSDTETVFFAEEVPPTPVLLSARRELQQEAPPEQVTGWRLTALAMTAGKDGRTNDRCVEMFVLRENPDAAGTCEIFTDLGEEAFEKRYAQLHNPYVHTYELPRGATAPSAERYLRFNAEVQPDADWPGRYADLLNEADLEMFRAYLTRDDMTSDTPTICSSAACKRSLVRRSMAGQAGCEDGKQLRLVLCDQPAKRTNKEVFALHDRIYQLKAQDPSQGFFLSRRLDRELEDPGQGGAARRELQAQRWAGLRLLDTSNQAERQLCADMGLTVTTDPNQPAMFGNIYFPSCALPLSINRQFRLELDTALLRVRAENAAYCLTVQPSVRAEADVVAVLCDASSLGQQWEQFPDGQLRHRQTGSCMAVVDLPGGGRNVVAQACSAGQANQMLFFDTSGSATTPETSQGHQVCVKRDPETGDLLETDVVHNTEEQGCITDWVMVTSPCGVRPCERDEACFTTVQNGQVKAECEPIAKLNACDSYGCVDGEYCSDKPPPALRYESDRECRTALQPFPGYFVARQATDNADNELALCPEGSFRSADMEECELHRVVDCVPGEVLAVKPSKVSDGRCDKCPEGTKPEEECTVGECKCMPVIYSRWLSATFTSATFDADVHRSEAFLSYVALQVEEALLLTEAPPEVKTQPAPVAEGGGVQLQYRIVDGSAEEDDEAENAKRILAQVSREGDQFGLLTPPLGAAAVAGIAAGGGLLLAVAVMLLVRKVSKKRAERRLSRTNAAAAGDDEDKVALGAPSVNGIEI